jgi:hypothetical protein
VDTHTCSQVRDGSPVVYTENGLIAPVLEKRTKMKTVNIFVNSAKNKKLLSNVMLIMPHDSAHFTPYPGHNDFSLRTYFMLFS